MEWDRSVAEINAGIMAVIGIVVWTLWSWRSKNVTMNKFNLLKNQIDEETEEKKLSYDVMRASLKSLVDRANNRLRSRRDSDGDDPH